MCSASCRSTERGKVRRRGTQRAGVIGGRLSVPCRKTGSGRSMSENRKRRPPPFSAVRACQFELSSRPYIGCCETWNALSSRSLTCPKTERKVNEKQEKERETEIERKRGAQGGTVRSRHVPHTNLLLRAFWQVRPNPTQNKQINAPFSP